VDIGLWFAPPDRHEQSVQRQIRVGAALHRPANHATRKQVNHDGQTQQPLKGPIADDVGDPELIRGIDAELPIQRTVGNNSWAATVKARLLFVTNLGPLHLPDVPNAKSGWG
jgi:hypothetical protein